MENCRTGEDSGDVFIYVKVWGKGRRVGTEGAGLGWREQGWDGGSRVGM